MKKKRKFSQLDSKVETVATTFSAFKRLPRIRNTNGWRHWQRRAQRWNLVSGHEINEHDLDEISSPRKNHRSVRIEQKKKKTREILLFSYSHTSNVIGDMLWLLGGINSGERRPPGLCRIDLITGEATEFDIPVKKRQTRHFNDVFRF